MRIEHFEKNLRKRAERSGLQYELFGPAEEDLIEQAERKLGLVLPDQVRLFYFHHNGLSIVKPRCEVLPLEQLSRDHNGMIPFAIFEDQRLLCFDSSELNQAGQWSIINCETGYRITLTMASFWSNKVFAWIDSQRPIWKEFD